MIELAEILTEPVPTPFWRALRQVGVDHAVGVLPRAFADWREAAGDLPWDYAPLAVYRQLVEEEGFSLDVIEDNPPMEAIRAGGPGREEELEQLETLVRNMGRLGIGVLCYHWMAHVGWLRTSSRQRGRGGAMVTAFDLSLLRDAPPPAAGTLRAEALWDNLRTFLDRIAPVAEEAGVRLALHPDDPPLPSVRGVDRIMSSVEAFERLVELHPSPANGITLCQGNFTLMTDDLPTVIRRLGETGRIHFVHFRDVRGTPEHFVETFHDEGPTDMLACLRAYREAGVEARLRTDHVPVLEGDAARVAGYSDAGRLFAIGYVRGLHEAAYGKAVTG